MREPDFRGVASAINFGGFEDAKRHAAAEDGDGLSVIEGIFDDEPAANVKETKNKSEQEQEAQATGMPRVAAARRDNRGRKIIMKSHLGGRIVACDGEVVNRRSAGYTVELIFLEDECAR
jgi:hypothetical protein